jgi:AraC-like DNA-binding protein
LFVLSNRDSKFAFGDSEAPESRPRFVRSASLRAVADAAKSLGLDPYHMLRRAGLPVAALDDPDHMIPGERIQALLADCAKAAHCDEFGLLAGAHYRISTLGPIGLLLRQQATARDALGALARYIGFQTEDLEIGLEPRGSGGLWVAPRLQSARTRSSRQMVEMTLAMLVQIVRGLLGEDWRPAVVAFAHPPPHDVAAYRPILGEVEFGARQTGFLLSASDAATMLPGADPETARQLARIIEASALPQNATLSETVHALILRLLPGGECGVDRIAELLGVDRRTVQRRLAAEGKSFTQLLESARREVATWQLSHGDQPLTEVTALVGFSSLSTFSRWFRQAYGIQPSEYRRQTHAA